MYNSNVSLHATHQYPTTNLVEKLVQSGKLYLGCMNIKQLWIASGFMKTAITILTPLLLVVLGKILVSSMS